MKMTVNRALGLGLFLLMGGVNAQQNIGNSVYICDGAAQAGPCESGDDGYASSSPRPAVKWADRWGAIAGDDRGAFGIVEGKESKREAQKAAISECKSRGGGACAVKLAYYNQCAAVASSTDFSTTFRASTIEEAKSQAISQCNNDGTGECWIYYSGCSLPERIQ